MKNMSYDEFCSYMQEKIQQYYGVEADVRLHSVKKVNGVVEILCQLCIWSIFMMITRKEHLCIR